LNYEIVNLFPVLVMRFPNFLESSKCDLLVDTYKNMASKHDYFTNDANCSHGSNSCIIDDITNTIRGFEDFSSRINDTLLRYSDVTGFLPTKITNSWFNIQRKGSALHDHMHPLSYVSGCLYLSVPEGSNNIIFSNPSQIPCFIPKQTDTVYSCETYWMKPSKGELILFPGWIKHGSNGHENNSDNRATISFNSMTYED
jgi:uncharacterized protein (TIGR02466 family)